MHIIYIAIRHSLMLLSPSSKEEQKLPTELPTERKQYDHNEGKAREIKQLTDSARAPNNGA